MITLEDVHFSYTPGVPQISGVSARIRTGELVVLTGPSGCGKTTLTRIMNGLVPRFYGGELTGTVTLDGTDTSTLQAWEFGNRVGCVFQDPKTQFFTPMVLDELAFGCENYGLPTPLIRERIDEAVVPLRIQDLLDRSLFTLSSGEKQKVAVAAASTTHPRTYVLDEPSANLDPDATEELARVLGALKAAGHTIVIAEHRLAYLMSLADRVLYMRDARITREFTPTQLLELSPEALMRLGLRATSRSPLPSETGRDLPPVLVERTVTPSMELSGVTVRVDRRSEPLISDAALTLHPGEIVALTGRNGAGKTTLARVITGLMRERRGRVAFHGSRIRRTHRGRHAWFVMQDTDNQLFSDSVLGEMTHGSPSTEADIGRAEALLSRLGLWEYRERHPGSLSGGQKQRLTIAVALMQDRTLTILDEPTSGLDGRNLRRVAGCLTERAAAGSTFLVITHDPEFIASACTRIVSLASGTIHEGLTTDDTWSAR